MLFVQICENKGADQLGGNRAADQRICFRYIDNNEHREMRPKVVVEYPILIAHPSMYGMLKVCSVNDLHFRISSARVKSSL